MDDEWKAEVLRLLKQIASDVDGIHANSIVVEQRATDIEQLVRNEFDPPPPR